MDGTGGGAVGAVAGGVYAIEAEIRGRSAEYRRQQRQERSRPIVEALRDWLHHHVGRVPAASDLARAMRYALRQWAGLVVFLDDGRVEMNPNVVERAIRPHALARKNALFAGSDCGAERCALAMTPIRTEKLNGVDLMAWLTDVAGTRRLAKICANRPAPAITSRSAKIGRNGPRPCRPGKKFKRCCGTA